MATIPTLPPAQLAETRRPVALGATIAFFVADVIAVALRLCTRRLTRQPFWWDDWTCLAALTFVVPFVICAFFEIHDGIGGHIQLVQPASLISIFKFIRVTEILYTLILAAAKFSVLLYYMRLFHPRSAFRLPFWGMLTLISLWTAGVLLTIFAQCKPFDAMWYPKKGTCISMSKFYIGVTVPNIVTDFLLLVMPMPFIFALQLSLGKKIAVTCALGLGGLVIIASAFRLAETLKYSSSVDFTWDLIPVSVWSTVEVMLAVICACLPTIAPLPKLLFGRARDASRSRPTDATTTTTDTGLGSDSNRNTVNSGGFSKLQEQHSLELKKQPSVSQSGGDAELAAIV